MRISQSLCSYIYSVPFQIYNRLDGNLGNRLDGATVSLDGVEVGVVAWVSGQQPYTFIVGGYGTTVKIIVPGDVPLSLAEVEIYGRSRSPEDGKKMFKNVKRFPRILY